MMSAKLWLLKSVPWLGSSNVLDCRKNQQRPAFGMLSLVNDVLQSAFSKDVEESKHCVRDIGQAQVSG